MYTHRSDKEITELIRQGDELAFSELYDRYFRDALRFSYKITADTHASEDICQDVFLNIWNSRAQAEIENISKYLFTCIKFGSVRYVSRRARMATPGDRMPESTDRDNPENIYNNRFLQQLIQEEVNQLPDKCRQVFQFSRGEGLASKQIANKLGISHRTVDKHLETAMTKLKKSLKNVATAVFWFF